MINFGCKERVYAVNFSSIKVNNPSMLMGCFKLGNRCNTFAECYGLVEVQFMKYAMNIPDEKVNKAISKIHPDFSHRDNLQNTIKQTRNAKQTFDKTITKTANSYECFTG